MRLVDGEKINHTAFPNPYSQNTSERDQYFAYERAKFDFWEKVKGLPTIDPVKDLWPKSFWVPVDENETDGWDAESAKHAKMQCFSCFCKPQRDSNGENILSKFCPNCGAMMEELK